MTELGYMAKRIAGRPDWLDVHNVRDIYSVANCVSGDFCDYIRYWKHNGFWFFDSAAIIRDVAAEAGVELTNTALVYYQGYERQYDPYRKAWVEYSGDACFRTAPVPPKSAVRLGYDVVTYSMQNAPECSPLSCNQVAKEVLVNEHCLCDSLGDAIDAVERGVFDAVEPGPQRIIAVAAVPWPQAR